ncbi:phospho-2-dehydro-3-deoxyheptonate aldolase 2, chloroplastic-like [Musa acuminata AAA Group]|uniref:phospho-2-dehydro-3-deoxyheptonate aldolase 2, chloroplastic-like n=1 Tax=Musa acuminata AAA Group TaxID=214697 RepID=UPI0031CE02D2
MEPKGIIKIPAYPDPVELDSVLRSLEACPPLVFAGEARKLEERLAEVAFGRAFLLQGGDRTESFREFSADEIRDTFRVLLQMGLVLTFGGQMPTIKGGDIINGDTFDEKVREPDPRRLMKGYSRSAATLNLLGAFATGGYASIDRVTEWNLGFLDRREQGVSSYEHGFQQVHFPTVLLYKSHGLQATVVSISHNSVQYAKP